VGVEHTGQHEKPDGEDKDFEEGYRSRDEPLPSGKELKSKKDSLRDSEAPSYTGREVCVRTIAFLHVRAYYFPQNIKCTKKTMRSAYMRVLDKRPSRT
jgi:hypothetical protein